MQSINSKKRGESMNLRLSSITIVLKKNISFLSLGLCKSMIFSQSTLRAQREESIAPAKSILSVNSVPSVRDIFFVFAQSQDCSLFTKSLHSYLAGSLLSLFFFSDCIYLQNQKLEQINYPETEFFSGFYAGQNEVNPIYFKEWCKKYCEQIREISQSLGSDYYIEIRGKMDATELPENRKLISQGRANSIKQLLFENGIEETKLKAIADPEPNQHLGKDKFDPKNRTVRFRIQKKD